MKYLITLVHGTFANHAPWSRGNSEFCNQIKEKLDSNSVATFQTFDWSGANSHKARIKAADDLAEVLKAQNEQFPKTKKIIISHSHGANVSMYALKRLENDSENFELIAMAAPFLNSTARDFQQTLKIHLALVPTWFCIFVTAILLTTMGVIVHFIPGVVDDDVIIYFVFALIFMALFSIFKLGSMVKAFMKNKSVYVASQVNVLMGQICINNIEHPYPILAVINHSDEIKLWFGNLYRFWELILNLHELITSTTRRILNFCLHLYIYTIFVVILDAIFHFGLEKPYIFVFKYSLIAGICLFVMLPPLTLLLPALFFFIKSNPLMLGWESWIHQMFIRTNPAATPMGYRRLNFIQYDLKRSSLLSLNHSIYEHTEVISDICKWINIKTK